MSKREFDQLETLLGVQSGRLRVADACALLGRSRRQVFRMMRGLREAGASSLLSKRRGKPSNRRLPDAVRQLAMSLVRERYGDFGPTLAAGRQRTVNNLEAPGAPSGIGPSATSTLHARRHFYLAPTTGVDAARSILKRDMPGSGSPP